MKGWRRRAMQGCETYEEFLRRVLRDGNLAEWRRFKERAA